MIHPTKEDVERWKADPVAFVAENLPPEVTLSPWQLEAIQAITVHRRCSGRTDTAPDGIW